GEAWRRATEELALLDAVGADLHPKSFLTGESSPLFVGSAVTNFGVRHLLDAVVDLAPSPGPRVDREGAERPLDAPFAGFVFKVQANMDPSHRDHVAFLRVCAGRFERGTSLTHEPTGRPFPTKYAASVLGAGRETIDVAYPGDVVGLVNASGLQIGDTLFSGPPVAYPGLPAFPPELFAPVRATDSGRYKQFHRGLGQLEREGVVQVLRDPAGQGPPLLGAVGPMQFEVFAHRMANEFGAAVTLSATRSLVARRTDEPTADNLRRGVGGVQVMARRDGSLLALFDSTYWLGRAEADHPEWCLEAPVEGVPAA
ncbi:MAG: peptide chain release factor 3, partial [Acidimicrobiales bacterium]